MKFKKPPHEHIDNHKYKDHTNRTINRELVISMERSRQHYYPDNEGIPTIIFWFGEKTKEIWYFDKGSEAFRDKVFIDLQK